MKADYRTRQNRISDIWMELHWKKSESDILALYAKRWNLSERQVYRYLEEAKRITSPVVIAEYPGRKQLFSVRLSESILERLRIASKVIKEPMSVIIENALDMSLKRIEGYQATQDEAAKAKPLRKPL